MTILRCFCLLSRHSTTIVYSTYCSNVAFSGIKSSLILFQLQKSIVNMYFTFNFTCTTVYSTLHSNVAFLAFLMSLIHLARRFYVAPVYRPNIYRLTPFFHTDPSLFNTVFTVCRSIFISNPKFQLYIYSVSNLTTSSKSVMSLRPLTCHIPVIPGLIAILAL